MACTDVANVKAKATAINLIILSSNVNLQDLPPQTRLFKRTSLSREEKSREGQNIVTPKKGRAQFGTDRRPKALFARVPGGKYRHISGHIFRLDGVLAMWPLPNISHDKHCAMIHIVASPPTNASYFSLEEILASHVGIARMRKPPAHS